MSIIVSVKINDGVVMAADSATTFLKGNGEPGQIYQNANKIVNLVKGLPVGVMTCGSAGIGNASIETLLKDLRVLLSAGGKHYVDPAAYSMESVAGEVKRFFEERIGTVHSRDY
jgi:metal-dependent hydrolase (beta-lactamase superfamily II)